MDTVVSDEKEDPTQKTGTIFVNEKTDYQQDTSGSSQDGHAHVYDLENMVRDDEGRIVVETSELAVTVLHVDDDPTLSPWTFRTFFLGMLALSIHLVAILTFIPQVLDCPASAQF